MSAFYIVTIRTTHLSGWIYFIPFCIVFTLIISIIDIHLRIIKELVERRYELIKDATAEERGYLLMTIGEIGGIIEMADAMKEVLKA